MKQIRTLIATAAIAIAGCFGANAQLLYKVEKQGSDKVSYILGTHHFAPVAVIDSISELPGIINSVDKLYGELDMSVMKDQATIMGMQQKMMATPDSTLDKVFTTAELDTIQSMLDRYLGGQITVAQLNLLKPATITTQAAAHMAMKIFPDQNPLEGIDDTMQERAREAGKPVAGLETMDFQLSMLYDRPISEQAKGLLGMARDPEKEEAKAIALSQAYLNHNIDKILQMMSEDEEEGDAEHMERLLYSRNDNWIKQLSNEMPSASLMVVVGAGHLPGPRGDLEGLRNAGFTVTPIK